MLVIADKYRVLETIGRGAMGVVYRASQENLGRIVAVKMLTGGALAGEESRQRFVQEAKHAASLRHPNIVTVFDWGEDRGQPYFSMEFVEGRSLAELVREGPLEVGIAVRFMRSIAGAVGYAHDQGIVHRDLKPSNVLVDALGEPKVADFGLAKQLGEDAGLTLSGQILGTPGYLSPEQTSTRHGSVGPLSDVYALGALFYCLLTGKPPFSAGTIPETLRQVSEHEPVPPCRLNPSVPRDLETICL
jgi:serine/threonine-protein kinase